MLCVGLIVEGAYDEATLRELAQKCVPSEARIICRRCDSRVQLLRKFPAFLEDFRHANNGAPVDKALVIRDADHKNPAELIAKMEAKITNRMYSFPRRLVIAVEELEAWFLADEEALSFVTGRKVRRVTDPEKIWDPKARLRNVLSEAGVVYTAEVARKIAVASRLDILVARCPSFRAFQDAIVN